MPTYPCLAVYDLGQVTRHSPGLFLGHFPGTPSQCIPPTPPLSATAHGRAAGSFFSLPLASVDEPRNGCLPQSARGAAGRGRVCRMESGAAGVWFTSWGRQPLYPEKTELGDSIPGSCHPSTPGEALSSQMGAMRSSFEAKIVTIIAGSTYTSVLRARH